jgi:hypothetical protein
MQIEQENIKDKPDYNSPSSKPLIKDNINLILKTKPDKDGCYAFCFPGENYWYVDFED